MSEFILDDGRKAEKVENNPDSVTKVTELYVEPKRSKRLSQRITERFCVCEREIETVDEETGEVVDHVIENLCSAEDKPSTQTVKAADGPATQTVNHPMKAAVEKRISDGSNKGFYIFGAIVVVQVLALLYVLFAM
jgi:hypothetical protein